VQWYASDRCFTPTTITREKHSRVPRRVDERDAGGLRVASVPLSAPRRETFEQ
jgi:hypothetical protein